jgi:Tol biopolymer transport system component
MEGPPDGKFVVFSRVTERGKGGKLFVMGIDGSGMRQLSMGTTGDEAATWSPDGRYLAYQANVGRGQGTNIAVLEFRSGVQRVLTNNGPGRNDETPSWFPDGKRLAIQSDRDGAWNIYLIDLEGKTLAQLTRRPQ